MKIREFLLCGLQILLAAFLIIGCINKPGGAKENEPLYGTWTSKNEGVYIYNPDGAVISYKWLNSEKPDREGRFTIKEKWIDEKGYIYYKVVEKWAPYPYDETLDSTWYNAIKINPLGDTLESIGSQNKYEEIIPTSEYYKKIYRQ